MNPDHTTSSPTPRQSTRELTYIQAVVAAQRWALEQYPDVVVYGEDVGKPGGPFGSARGLQDRFGPGRVFDTPISETAMLGAAVGAAMRGLRPVVEIMFMDFTLVALDAIVNQAANVRYVSRGAWTAPLTVRTQQGVAPGSCAQHSQSLEAFFAHVPGLHVAVPATPQDAYELLRTAIATDDPAIVIENRTLYGERAEVTVGGPLEPLGGARVVRAGGDVTVVAWSKMVGAALEAADRLAAGGTDVEVVDLRWLAPLDMGTVLASVARTGRLVIAHEATLTGGFGGEIAARAAADAFFSLDAPIVRVGAPPTRIPAAPSLQAAVVPGTDEIVAAVEGLAAV